MRSKFLVIALGSTLAACATHEPDVPAAGMEPVNVPVVTRSDYVVDLPAPGGVLAPGQAERLDGWFSGLGVRYGDSIYVDSPSYPARSQVEDVAGRYGLLVLSGAPVTGGVLAPQTVRVIVSRTEARVPNCPNWSVPSQPNFANAASSNFGCSVNTNIAAMVANPEDLVHGRDSAGTSDARTAAKSVGFYRNAPPTGEKGLQAIDTKKD